MSEHSYNQYCSIAHALDLIGDRWALLIVRDLLLGPKRFTDLKAGLPGLGTNILTARLKDMERSGIVTRRALPFPAAATVYELTPYGLRLGPTLGDLARWGSETLGSPQPGQAVSADAVMLAVSGLFRRRTNTPPGSYALHFDEPSLRASVGVYVEGGSVRVSRDAPEQPDVTITTDVETMVHVTGGHLSLHEAVERGVMRMGGDPPMIAGLIASNTAPRPRG